VFEWCLYLTGVEARYTMELMAISTTKARSAPPAVPERGDTVEIEIRGRLVTGTVSSAYMAAGKKGPSPRVTVTSGGQKYTRLASSVHVTRKAATTPAPAAGSLARPGEPAPNSGSQYPAEPLSTGEVVALLGRCSRRAPTGIRNRALIMLLYRSGLRVSEALSIRAADVNLDSHSIRLLDTKSGQPQTRGYHPDASDALARWMDKRRELGLRNGKLFCTLDGSPVSANYVRNMLHRLGEKAGIEKRVHPHGLRHTFADELQRNGADIVTISKLLGHSSIAVTARYLDHLTNAQAVERLQTIQLPSLD
jgi:integrase